MVKYKICILGTGNMGEAILKGILTSGLYSKKDIIVTDVAEDRLSYLHERYNVKTTRNNAQAASSSRYIMMTVKPAVIKSLISEISHVSDESKLIISVAAGISINNIRIWFKKELPVIRVMPNIPVLVLEGATAIASGPGVRPEEIDDVKKIFDSVGKSILLGEEHINAVTGLSGSGPAYIFAVIDALSDGGVKVGLPRQAATLLAAQTVLGAAKMVLESGEHPGRLKDMITSPGGTTIEGLHTLEMSGIRGAFISAVQQAANKADELGKRE